MFQKSYISYRRQISRFFFFLEQPRSNIMRAETQINTEVILLNIQ